MIKQILTKDLSPMLAATGVTHLKKTAVNGVHGRHANY